MYDWHRNFVGFVTRIVRASLDCRIGIGLRFLWIFSYTCLWFTGNTNEIFHRIGFLRFSFQFDRKVNKSSDFMESFLTRNQTTRALFRSVRAIFFGLAMLLERTYPSLLHTHKSNRNNKNRARGGRCRPRRGRWGRPHR